MARVLSLDFNIDNSHGTVCLDHGQTRIGRSERGGACSVSVFNKQFAPCIVKLICARANSAVDIVYSFVYACIRDSIVVGFSTSFKSKFRDARTRT